MNATKRKVCWLAAVTTTLACAAGTAHWLSQSPARFAERAPLPALGVALDEEPSEPPVAPLPSLDDLDEPSAAPEGATPAPLVRTVTGSTPKLSETENILIAGLDRRPDGSGPTLTDTLLVVVVDEASPHVGLVSVPRDLWVDIPEVGAGRINTVYQASRRVRRDPLLAMREVVGQALSLPIKGAIVLDLGVFERAVDAVGGVTVQVQCPLLDRFIDPRVEGGRRLLDVEPGPTEMDGVTAAMYARSRHGRSDFDRARRQQAILLGVQHALRGAGVSHLPALWSQFENSIETDMSRFELMRLGRRALRVEPSHLHGLVLGGAHVQGFHTDDGKSVLQPNFEAIDRSLGKLFSEPGLGARARAGTCAPKDAAVNRGRGRVAAQPGADGHPSKEPSADAHERSPQ